MTYHRVCNQSNTMGVTCEVGPAYLSGPPKFAPFSPHLFQLIIDEGGPLLSMSSIKLGLLKENDK
jgi:hypothetical protein